MQQRLHIRVGITVAVIALTVACITSVAFYFVTHAQTLKQARQTLAQLAATVQNTAGIAVFLDNREIADEVISGLAKNEFVDTVSLTSATGLRVVHGPSPDRLDSAETVKIKLESPFNAGETIGVLSIAPNQELITRKARKNALTGVAVLAGFILLVAFAITHIVQLLFVYPLSQVTSSLADIIPGETVLVPAPKKHQQDEIGELTSYLSHLLTIVKQKLDTERNLREEFQGLEKRFRMIFERAGIGIFLLDHQGGLLLANNSFKNLTGTICHPDSADCMGNCIRHLFKDGEAVEKMLQDVVTLSTASSADLQLNTRDGDERWVHCLFTRVLDETGEALLGETIMQGIVNDITDRKKREQLITYQAQHDPLTHLYNRRSMEEKLTATLQKTATGDNREENDFCVTLFLIDLDKFKPINDTYGHDAGDLVLIEVAQRLTSCLRQADIVARLGGDEFLAATIGKYLPEGTHRVAEKLLQTLSKEIAIPGGVTVSIGASIGISISILHGTDLEELISKADRAMYQIKVAGRNGYRIFSVETVGDQTPPCQ
jgi:diguanylate cyclase (GGDEF)-like protein/PAS domain S-box-containing protein